MLNLWPYRDDTPGVRHSFVDVTTGRGLIGVRFPGIFRGQNGFVQVFVRLAMVERVEVIVSCQEQSQECTRDELKVATVYHLGTNVGARVAEMKWRD